MSTAIIITAIVIVAIYLIGVFCAVVDAFATYDTRIVKQEASRKLRTAPLWPIHFFKKLSNIWHAR